MPQLNQHILIVIPIFNEEAALKTTVEKTLHFLNDETKYNYSVLIADNNSTDTSPDIAKTLAVENEKVSYLHLPRKGRGFALRTAWLETEADVLVYMDVDLSSPLKALPDLINPILDNQADIVFGSRLKPPHGKAVNRNVTREITSRGYNLLLQFFMGADFKDAQCGFKAFSKQAFLELEPETKNNTWFFDSELLLLGQYKKLRLKEIGIRWEDDPNSSVNIVGTALENLKEMWRMYIKYRPQSLFHKLFTFGIIGGLSTVGQLLLFLLLRIVLPSQVANTLSLIVLTILNTVANKRFSFRNKSTERYHHIFLVSLISFLVFWIPTTGALYILHETFGINDQPLTETIVILCASVVGTVLKFLFLSYIYTPIKKLRKIQVTSSK